jgi:hypothetical protein
MVVVVLVVVVVVAVVVVAAVVVVVVVVKVFEMERERTSINLPTAVFQIGGTSSNRGEGEQHQPTRLHRCQKKTK